MRMIVVCCVLTAGWLNIPTSADARIALNRARIVSIGVFEDDKKNFVFGNIVFVRGSLFDPKSDRVSANITKQTFLIGAHGGRALRFSDLKPGMAIEIVIAGGRGGTDQALEVRSIRVLTTPQPM